MARSVDEIINSAVADALLTGEKPSKHIRARLAAEGYYVVSPERLEWEDIRRFYAEKDRGQSIFEDAGGVMVRCLARLLTREVPDKEVVTYRRAADALIARQREYTRNSQ